mmetsp:Transcript_30345/g.40037  ORF Transcript_30345/g.40037 Transcript_30345/m.40037 type:complete len:271 (+) Transcript_30345:154-966(+)
MDVDYTFLLCENQRIEETLCLDDYTTFKDGVTGKQRMILFDWLVDVQVAFQLSDSSLFLAASLFDRYCMSTQTVKKKYIQLYGIVCLLLASKFHNEASPSTFSAKNCVSLIQNTFPLKRVLEAEYEVLLQVKHRLAIPTVMTFLHLLWEVTELPVGARELSSYLVHKTLYSNKLVAMRPSTLSTCCLYIAMCSRTTCQKMDEIIRSIDGLQRPLTQDLEYYSSVIKSEIWQDPISTKNNKVLDAVERKCPKIANRVLASTSPQEKHAPYA